VLAGSTTRRNLTGLLAASGGVLLASPALAALGPPPPVTPPQPVELSLEPDAAPTQVSTNSDKFEHIIAQVMVNGAGPFAFMVDTGANTSCVSRRLADALSLPAGPTVKVNTVLGPRPRASVVIDHLQIGTRARRNVAAPVLPMAGFEVDGVLGIDWLKGQRLVLGFADKRLEITGSRHEASTEGKVVVPARRSIGQLTIVDADMNGRPISAMIDSGSQVSIGNTALRHLIERNDSSFKDKATKVGLMSIAGEAFSGDQLYLPFMRLGGLHLGNVPVVFVEMPVFKLWGLQNKPTIMLGIDLLTQFSTVALDFGRAAVRFDLAEPMVASRS
jgi:predicted aspartyl protease